VTNGRQSGVELKDGRRFSAKAVACNAHARTLYLELLNEADVPGEVLSDIRNYRTFSTAFKINIACQRPPQYASLARALADGALGSFNYPTYAHIAPDIEYLERAFDDAKYGWYSARPFLTPVVPSLVDDTLSPPGKHVVNVFGGHAPYKLEGAEWADEKDNFKKTVFDAIDRFAPGFSSDVIHAQVLVPEDIEAIVGMPQGHIFHGELSLEQLFFKRPIPHYADYRTPIAGLYLCGSSAHPGGAVSGIPGHNAAREILADLKRKAS
jgi:phytoene dehydrogenase-like protein